MEFQQNLKALREKKGLTQEQLAEQLGIARQSVSKWELGINEPDLETLTRLCAILECDYEDLLEKKEEETAIEPIEAPREEQVPARKGTFSVTSMIFAIVWLLTQVLFAMAMPSVAGYSFIQIAFFGANNINLLALASVIVYLTSVVLMFLLAFMPHRRKALFAVRDGLLVGLSAYHAYILIFAIVGQYFQIGSAVLLLNALVMMTLHLGLPSLRPRGFVKSFGEECVVATRADTYGFASTLLFCLALFAVLRANFSGSSIWVYLYWGNAILGALGLVTMGALLLALPSCFSRRGIAIGTIVTLSVMPVLSILSSMDYFSLFTFTYAFYDLGVLLAVVLVTFRKKKAIEKAA